MRKLCHLFITLLLVSGCATEQAATKPYPPHIAAAEAQASVAEVLDKARASDRLAMLVLGANWCHDSVDFANMLAQPELESWIGQHYVVGLYNLGYLDDFQTYLAPYGVPVIYGTPTVLVIDPKTNQLLNPEFHYYWRNASQLTAKDARKYFSIYLVPPVEGPDPSESLAQALGQIDEFEARQADRITRAYAALGPMMRAYEAGNPPADFDDKWANLAGMRSKITGDLENLRQSAREQDAAGADPIVLDFPEYPLFIDP